MPPQLLNHVLGLRIRGCEFSGTRETVSTFAHPLLVREITFGACMTSTTTKEILSHCKNVEYLRYFVTERSDTAFHPSVEHEKYLRQLRRLKSIEIGILFFGRNRSSTSVASSVKTLLGNPTILYNGLQEIQIHFELTQNEWDIFYAFINRHAATICKLGVYRQCICEYDEHFKEDASSVRDHLTTAFKKCKLKNVTMIRGASYKCRCSGALLWSHLLGPQSGVESLCTDLVPNVAVLKDFVQKNQRTLSKLSLQDVSLGMDAHMDFSVFQECTRLQFLSLHFLSCAVIVMTMKMEKSPSDETERCTPFTERFSECSGLQFLPKSLKSLSIKGCDTLSSTLREMSYKLTNLTNLYLGSSGSPRRCGYGMTMDVFLEFLLRMPDLNHLTIHRTVFNFSKDQETKIRELGIANGENAEYVDLNLSKWPRHDLIEQLKNMSK